MSEGPTYVYVNACFPGDTAPLEGLDADAFGVQLNTPGMIVLLVAQTIAQNNGPWVVVRGEWYRPTPEVVDAELFEVQAPGTELHGSRWRRLTPEDAPKGPPGAKHYVQLAGAY